jgi:hypothetical protein
VTTRLVKEVRASGVTMSEADLQQNIVDLAHLLGYKVAHFRPALMKQGGALVYRTPVAADGKGFPDLLLAKPGQPGRILVIECKSEKGQQSPEQLEWELAFKGCCDYYLFRPSDWDRIVEVLSA